MTDIATAIGNAVDYLSQHREEAAYTDSIAMATLGDALRVEIVGPDGEALTTDMPQSIGGHGEQPSPGWLFRAAIASCNASLIGMHAARAGIEVDSLTVEVDSASNDLGILGIDPHVHAGPEQVSVRVTIEAADADAETLRELVEDAVAHCPVHDAVGRAVPMSVDVTVA